MPVEPTATAGRRGSLGGSAARVLGALAIVAGLPVTIACAAATWHFTTYEAPRTHAPGHMQGGGGSLAPVLATATGFGAVLGLSLTVVGFVAVRWRK